MAHGDGETPAAKFRPRSRSTRANASIGMRNVTSWPPRRAHNSGSDRAERYGTFASAAYGNANTGKRGRTSAGITLPIRSRCSFQVAWTLQSWPVESRLPPE